MRDTPVSPWPCGGLSVSSGARTSSGCCRCPCPRALGNSSSPAWPLVINALVGAPLCILFPTARRYLTPSTGSCRLLVTFRLAGFVWRTKFYLRVQYARLWLPLVFYLRGSRAPCASTGDTPCRRHVLRAAFTLPCSYILGANAFGLKWISRSHSPCGQSQT